VHEAEQHIAGLSVRSQIIVQTAIPPVFLAKPVSAIGFFAPFNQNLVDFSG
jgi:hypothetical protein